MSKNTRVLDTILMAILSVSFGLFLWNNLNKKYEDLQKKYNDLQQKSVEKKADGKQAPPKTITPSTQTAQTRSTSRDVAVDLSSCDYVSFSIPLEYHSSFDVDNEKGISFTDYSPKTIKLICTQVQDK